MLRQIIIPDKNPYPLQLPDEYVGQKVEVIAFTVDDDSKVNIARTGKTIDREIESFYRSINVKVSKDFKFNRDDTHER